MSTITENGSVVENTNTVDNAVDNAVDNTVVADVPASHESTASVETPVSQKQAESVNAEKDAKSDMVMSAFKNILPQWAKNLLQNPAIPALMVGLTAGPLAGVATFGTGALAKQFVKMNDTINAYKNKLVEDKDIQLNKDGTLAYTGTGTIKGSECLPGSCFGPFGKNPSHSLDGQSFGNIPTPHPPQLPPTVDEKTKEEPKKETPKKEEPKKETPKKEEPKKETPKKEEPKAEPKKEESKKEEPKAEPKKEESKKEEPKAEPKKEEPKKEEPKAEPKKEEPKKEEPKAEPKKEEPSIPQPVGGVRPKVPETQPTVEIPAPINQAPTTEAKPADKGDVIVTKPRVIKVGGEDKEAKENEEVEPKSGSSKEDRETDGEDKEGSKDSNVGIWENRDDIDANDTKDNKGGDYSNNNDNKSVSSAYEDLIKSFTEPTAPSDDGPEL